MFFSRGHPVHLARVAMRSAVARAESSEALKVLSRCPVPIGWILHLLIRTPGIPRLMIFNDIMRILPRDSPSSGESTHINTSPAKTRGVMGKVPMEIVRRSVLWHIPRLKKQRAPPSNGVVAGTGRGETQRSLQNSGNPD